MVEGNEEVTKSLWPLNMILAFESESSPVLDRFCSNFVEPDGIFKRIVHSISFTHKSFKRFGDTYIFEFDSFMDIIARRCLIVSVALFFVAWMFGWKFAMIIALITTLLSMFILAKAVREGLFWFELKRGGHQSKIRFLSLGALCSLLLFKLDEGHDVAN